MKNNELSPMEKLNLAIKSHRFYHDRCVDMEQRINKKIDVIFQTEEVGVEPTKEDISSTVSLVGKLLTLSTKYINEASNVVENLDNLNEKENDVEDIKNQLLGITEKQRNIHQRVTEMQEMLIEMYNLDEFEDDEWQG